jgi:hypothetical protein
MSQAPVQVEGVDRLLFAVLVLLKEGHEGAIPQIASDMEFGDANDAYAQSRQVKKQFPMIGRDAPAHADTHAALGPAIHDWPFAEGRLAGEVQTVVMSEILKRHGRTMSFQIGGSRADHPAARADLAPDQRRVRKLATSYGDVDFLPDEVGGFVA